MRSLVIGMLVLMACGRDQDDRAAAVPPTIVHERRDAGVAPPQATDGGASAAATPGGNLGVGPDVMAPSAPSSVTCDDPVAGIWIAKTYATTTGRWHEHRLTITKQGRDYVATQTTHMWTAGPDDAFPPACPTGGKRWTTVEMTDQAELLEDMVHVWGTAVTSNVTSCDDPPIPYNLDSFTGKLRRNSFKALNNDDADARDRPYLFRRIACGP